MSSGAKSREKPESFEAGEFSVLMSVYAGTKTEEFEQAMTSIWYEQVLKPGEICLVCDGPLAESLEERIRCWKNDLNQSLCIVRLKNNQGLARALNEGILSCRYDLIARMDSDDCSVPLRFKLQHDYMIKHADVAVLGGQVEEWDNAFEKFIAFRSVPQTHEEILKFSKFRSPVNHPTVMFRRQAVKDAGMYPEYFPEDYCLWVNMLAGGHRFANLKPVLVRMRFSDALKLRRGIGFYLRGEKTIFRHFLDVGFITKKEYFKAIAARFAYRLFPYELKILCRRLFNRK